MSNTPIAPFVDLLKTLAHPARLRILALLRDGELCVCQVADVLGIPTSTVSEHLTELRRAGLLAERKEGRWVYYGLSPRPDLDDLLAAFWPHVDPTDLVGRDREAAAITRGIPVDVTCARTKASGSNPGKGTPHAE